MSLLKRVNFTDENIYRGKKIKMIVEIAMSKMKDRLDCK